MLINESLLQTLAPWALLFPLVGLMINLLVGRRLGERGSGVLASIAAGLSFVVALLLALGLAQKPEALHVPLAEWISVGSLHIDWALRIDTLSSVMMLVVSGVGTLIHIYAIEYMHRDVRHNGDPRRYPRFFVFFNLFILAMLTLVMADNYLVLFVGWEGVGLCSYLLIGFWYEKGQYGTANARAGKKAFVTNRIGDFGLLMALFTMFWFTGSLSFDAVFAKAAGLDQTVILAITLFLLLGVTGKSAQLPLYMWLPDAMAGPTPVSALIHAATMVTAGVYLVARSAPLYVLAPTAQAVVTWVGALTALFAAGIAVSHYDIKKVLAYSTISQLGYMVAAVGMGAFAAGMFHLVTHAFFKALLFLGAGSVIQGLERGMEHDTAHDEHDASHGPDPQDMRSMGGLRSRMGTTFWVYLAGALALSGIAPLAGFFSKDEILAAAAHLSPAVYVLLALAALLTAFYMGRQVLMVFFGAPRTTAAEHATESPATITVPLVILALLAIFGGLINFPGLTWLEKWLEHSIEHIAAVEFTAWVALLSLALAVLGLLLAWLVYGRRALAAGEPDPLQRGLPFLFRGMARQWWLEDIVHTLFVEPYGKDPWASFARFMAQGFDLGFVDNISAALAWVTRALASAMRRLQNGFVHSYVLAVMLGAVLIMAYLWLR